MSNLKLVKSSRVDYGVQFQALNARLRISRIEDGRVTDDDEALEILARAIAYLVNAERYIRDPRGVWR